MHTQHACSCTCTFICYMYACVFNLISYVATNLMFPSLAIALQVAIFLIAGIPILSDSSCIPSPNMLLYKQISNGPDSCLTPCGISEAPSNWTLSVVGVVSTSGGGGDSSIPSTSISSERGSMGTSGGGVSGSFSSSTGSGEEGGNGSSGRISGSRESGNFGALSSSRGDSVEGGCGSSSAGGSVEGGCGSSSAGGSVEGGCGSSSAGGSVEGGCGSSSAGGSVEGSCGLSSIGSRESSRGGRVEGNNGSSDSTSTNATFCFISCSLSRESKGVNCGSSSGAFSSSKPISGGKDVGNCGGSIVSIDPDGARSGKSVGNDDGGRVFGTSVWSVGDGSGVSGSEEG